MAPPDLTSPKGSSPDGGAPAGYGRSCTNCSRAKCKCILRPGSGGICERCYRLGKECNPIAATRKRVEKKHSSSRTAQLEEKLDDLVSILRSSQGGAIPSSRPAYSEPHRQGHIAQPSRLDSLATAATASSPHAGFPSHPNLNANFNESDEHSEPTPAEAELYLQKFRVWLKNFPFMYIPPDQTAAELRRDRPFLWLCIMNITSMSVPQMLAMKNKVRREVAEAVVIRHEPTLEIVQGLLAYIGWAIMNSGAGWKPFVVLFANLALSVSYELGLTRSPAEEQYFATCFKAWGGRQPHPKPRTLEERRVLISLWFLTSIIASFIGKMEPLRWTPHMEESLEILERDKEYVQDEILTSLIRMQLVADEAHKLLVQDVMRGEDGGHTPSFVYRKSMLNQLQSARDNMTPTANASYIVQAQGYATEILIHSMGLFKTSMPDGQRIDALYSCLRAIRGWYDIFFSIPLPELASLPFAVFIQLSQTQIALYRLTMTDDPAWDKEVLRGTADLLVILDRTIERFDAMGSAYPMKPADDEETIFTRAMKILKNTKTSWEPALAPKLGGLSTPTGSTTTAGGTNGAGGPMPMGTGPSAMASGGHGMSDANGPFVDPVMMDFTDLVWMTDIFGPWDC